MDHEELNSFIQVWGFALLSLTYSYHSLSLLSSAVRLRLLLLFPVLLLLIYLPLRLTTLHLSAPTSAFLVWLANSKLLLLAFHRGPLVHSPNLLNFLVVAILPVKLSSSSSSVKLSPPCFSRIFLLLLKALLLGCIIQSYDYRPSLHPVIIYALLCAHLYLELEIVMKLCAVPAMVLLRRRLEPQFDEPYLATSLQDFWGRRWNLMINEILRSTVYDPIRQSFARSTVIGKDSIRVVATLATFAVSGVMHEVLYVYMTRVRPTWEVTWFFVLHGVCVVAEVEVKRRIRGRWKVRAAVSRAMTVGFVGSTGVWLFWPQLVRDKVVERVLAESSFGLNLFKEICLCVF